MKEKVKAGTEVIAKLDGVEMVGKVVNTFNTTNGAAAVNVKFKHNGPTCTYPLTSLIFLVEEPEFNVSELILGIIIGGFATVLFMQILFKI